MSVKTNPRRQALRQVEAITKLDVAAEMPYSEFAQWQTASVPISRRTQHERVRALLGH
jgi:hypothetical protein